MKLLRYLATFMVIGICLAGISFAMDKSKNGTEVMSSEVSMFPGTEIATFAGGCFWCTESDFEKVEGVVEVISGYIGGHVKNPTYAQVSSGSTGHTEAIQIYYDPKIVTYEELLEVLWKRMDPTDPNGQFVDRGTQYRPGIYYHSEEQKRLAEASRMKLEQSGRFNKPIKTEIVKAKQFYRAEEYHQDYHKNHSLRYKYYRYNSGRDQFLKKVWGDEIKMMSQSNNS